MDLNWREERGQRGREGKVERYSIRRTVEELGGVLGSSWGLVHSAMPVGDSPFTHVVSSAIVIPEEGSLKIHFSIMIILKTIRVLINKLTPAQ